MYTIIRPCNEYILYFVYSNVSIITSSTVSSSQSSIWTPRYCSVISSNISMYLLIINGSIKRSSIVLQHHQLFCDCIYVCMCWKIKYGCDYLVQLSGPSWGHIISYSVFSRTSIDHAIAIVMLSHKVSLCFKRSLPPSLSITLADTDIVHLPTF